MTSAAVPQLDAPYISVIINCYNGEQFLRQAIDSVLNQNFQDWELIFWDNQSTDDSATILASYGDERIHYFYAETHSALGEARSCALAQANGRWVGFLDVDDLWFPEKLQRQVDAIEAAEKSVGMTYCRCEYFRYTEKLDGSMQRETRICPGSDTLPQENLADELYFGNLIPFPSLLYKRGALDAIGGIPPYRHPPDYYMSLAIASRFGAIAVDEVLCGYRLHDSNLSWSIKEDGYREPIDIVRKVAPKEQCSHLSRYNVTRYVIYLLRQRRVADALKEMGTIGVVGFVSGVLGLLRYRRRYACGH